MSKVGAHARGKESHEHSVERNIGREKSGENLHNYATEIKDLLTIGMIFENSLKIAQTFRRVQFERIFKYHEQCKSFIARAFIRLLIYYTCITCKITKARALICTADLFFSLCTAAPPLKKIGKERTFLNRLRF